jgi:lipopolysaccharide assembly protein B
MIRVLFFLLPVAAICGWYFGYRSSSAAVNASAKGGGLSSNVANGSNNKNAMPEEYFAGLNYLINEQPDKAVDAFVKVIAVNSDTVEMHLSLGNLFRRRGEVDRAIRVHQNLIARPQLTKEQRSYALSELAQDYLRAGVLDRAERLFLELVEMGKSDIANYNFLLSIYEKQKDWRQAIAMAQKLTSVSRGKMWTPIAYYYCELAEEALDQGLIDQAEVYLKKALVQDRNCARASIMLGNLAVKGAHYKTAIHFYRQVQKQDSDFLPEVVPQLANCYEQLGKIEEFFTFVKVALQESYSGSLALALVKYIDRYYGAKATIDFIATQHSANQHVASLRVLEYLLHLCINNAGSTEMSVQVQSNVALARQLLVSFLNNKPYCRCSNCGLGTKRIYWQCPGCMRWATLKPIRKFEIE